MLARCGVHGRCFNEIRAFLGIDSPELWTSPRTMPPPSPSPPRSGQGGRQRRPLPDHATRYDYEKANGELAFAVLRFEPKAFAVFTPSTTPGMFYPVGSKRLRPLFRLPALMYVSGQRRQVMVCEGEKDALNAMRARLHLIDPTLPRIVTTWSGGVLAWGKTDWTPLAGWAVDLLAHADPAGRRAMWEIAGHLHRLGCTVRLVLPPDNEPRGNDLSDWLSRDRLGLYHTAWYITRMLRPFDPDYPPPPAPGPQPKRTGTFLDNLDYSQHAQRRRGQRRVQQRREANAQRDARIHELHCQGLTVKTIADALDIAPSTVGDVVRQRLHPSNQAKAKRLIAFMESGQSIPDAARQLGMARSTAYDWVHRLRPDLLRRRRTLRGARGRERKG